MGIDPGLSTAVAIIDLRGEIVGLRSCRGFSFRQILEFVSGRCTPLLIASDVSPPARLLGRVAAAFSVAVHEPAENFSRTAKSRLVEQFDLSERERHKKDALAAAVCAYRSKLPVIRSIEKRIAGCGMEIDVEDVAMKVFTGECSNISSAISKLSR